PVGEHLGGALAQATASGNAELRLALQLPLGELEQSTVKGSVQLPGNDLRLRPDVPMLAMAKGRVDFSRQGVQIVGASARALGGSATPRDQLRVEVGSVLQALFVRELGKDGPRVLRSAIGLNTAMPQPVAGGHAVAEFNQSVSIDAWRTALAAFGGGVGVDAG